MPQLSKQAPSKGPNGLSDDSQDLGFRYMDGNYPQIPFVSPYSAYGITSCLGRL